MPSFAEIQKDNFYRVLLNTEQFAEVVTLCADGEPDRPLTCVFRRTAADAVDGHTESDVETASVRVGRDEAHAKGGIASPRRGMQILRGGEGAPYAFNGVVLLETSHSFVLQFSRPRLTRIGKR